MRWRWKMSFLDRFVMSLDALMRRSRRSFYERASDASVGSSRQRPNRTDMSINLGAVTLKRQYDVV